MALVQTRMRVNHNKINKSDQSNESKTQGKKYCGSKLCYILNLNKDWDSGKLSATVYQSDTKELFKKIKINLKCLKLD